MKNMLKTRATFTFCATISTLPLAGLMTHPLMVLLFPDKSTKNTISLKIQMEIETKLVQVVYLLLLLLLLQTTTTHIYSYVLQFICRTVVAILTSTLANQKIFMLLLMVLSNNFEKKGRKDYKSIIEALIVVIKEF